MRGPVMAFAADLLRQSSIIEGAGTYVQMSGRNRIGPHWGGIERLTKKKEAYDDAAPHWWN